MDIEEFEDMIEQLEMEQRDVKREANIKLLELQREVEKVNSQREVTREMAERKISYIQGQIDTLKMVRDAKQEPDETE
jgi:hypothetical protein